jgi:hypothetical protein
MQVAFNIRLYEYGHEQVKLRKKRWNNNFFIENKYVNIPEKRILKYVLDLLKRGMKPSLNRPLCKKKS